MAFGWHVDKFTDWFAVSWSSSAASAALTLLTLACWSLILGRPQTHQKQNIPCFLQAGKICSIRLLNWLSRLESHPLSIWQTFYSSYTANRLCCSGSSKVSWKSRRKKNCNIGDIITQWTSHDNLKEKTVLPKPPIRWWWWKKNSLNGKNVKLQFVIWRKKGLHQIHGWVF